MARRRRKASRRTVRCTLCTKHRWRGNSSERYKPKEQQARERARKDAGR